MAEPNTIAIHKDLTDIHIEDTSNPSHVDGQVKEPVHVEHEIWDGINPRTILAFLVCFLPVPAPRATYAMKDDD